jgi:hypothetical protein
MPFPDLSLVFTDSTRVALTEIRASLGQCGDAQPVLAAMATELEKGCRIADLRTKRLDKALVDAMPAIAQAQEMIRSRTPTTAQGNQGMGSTYQDRESFILSDQKRYEREAGAKLKDQVSAELASLTESTGQAMYRAANAVRTYITATLAVTGGILGDVMGKGLEELQLAKVLERSVSTMTFIEVSLAHQSYLALGQLDYAKAIELAAEPIATDRMAAIQKLRLDPNPAKRPQGNEANAVSAEYNTAQNLINEFRAARMSRRPEWVPVAVQVTDILQTLYEQIAGASAVSTRRPTTEEFPASYATVAGYLPYKRLAGPLDIPGPKVARIAMSSYRDADGASANPHAPVFDAAISGGK